MNLFFRLFGLIIKSWFHKTKPSFLDETWTHYRVYPTDLDMNIHMTNSRYFCFMDLGRMDMLLKTKTLKPLFGNGYFPVVASQSIRFKRSLKPFEKFSLKTQVINFDEKDFFMKQTFYFNGNIAAEGLVKGRFKKKGQGSVRTEDLFKFLGEDYMGNSMSELSQAQKQIESLLCKPGSFEPK